MDNDDQPLPLPPEAEAYLDLLLDLERDRQRRIRAYMQSGGLIYDEILGQWCNADGPLQADAGTARPDAAGEPRGGDGRVGFGASPAGSAR